MTVEEVAERLYGLSPEEFTASRTAAAKADKANAKAITAFRKPTVGAWLINTLARSEQQLLTELLALGPALAEAQSAGKGTQLRELGEQRRRLVGVVTDRAFAAADRAPTAVLRAEIESTVDAALADPATADAVRTGRLTRSLSYAGFGGVDLEGSVAVGRAPVSGRASTKATKPAVVSPPKPGRGKDIAAAEARAHELAGALDDAVRACQQARHDQDEAEQREQRAAAEVVGAEHALHAARAARTLAEQQARKARHRTEQAAKTVESAQAEAEKARNALDKLRRS